jgi:hypothetical protein
MQLDEEQRRILRRLRKAPSDFATLVKLAGLDPRQDFRGVSLRGVDFGRADVSDFDFTDADLSGADLRRATVGRALEAAASLEDARFPREALEEVLDRRPQLRPFQQAAVEAVLDRLDSGGRRAFVALAAGLGKTAIIGEVIDSLRQRGELRRALILVESRSLAEQVVSRLREACPGLRVDRFHGQEVWPENRVLVAQVNRGYVLDPKMVDFVSAAMRSPSEMSHIFLDDAYRLPKALVRRAAASHSKIIGFSTAFSGGKSQLRREIFELFAEDLVFEYDLARAIRDGNSTPIELNQRWLRYSDFPPQSEWPKAGGGKTGMASIFAEELAERGAAERGGSRLSTALIFDTGAPLAQMFDLLAYESYPRALAESRSLERIKISHYNKYDKIKSMDIYSSNIVICDSDELDEFLLKRCDRLVLFGRDVPKIISEIWLSSASPFRRSIVDYVGKCADAFRSTHGEGFGGVVRLVSANAQPPRPVKPYSAA